MELNSLGVDIMVYAEDFAQKWIQKYGKTPFQEDIELFAKQNQRRPDGSVLIHAYPLSPEDKKRVEELKELKKEFSKLEDLYIEEQIFKNGFYDDYLEYRENHRHAQLRLPCDKEAYEPECRLDCDQFPTCRGGRLSWN